MSGADLRLDQAPPFSIPLRFFLTAPFFGVAACLLLLTSGPEVFASRWTVALLAVTHLLTLGFLTMTMMGALLQLLPVLAGCTIPRPRLIAGIVHALMILGTALLAASFLFPKTGIRHGALGALGLAVTIFIAAALRGLVRVRTSASANGMRVALASLGVTGAFGILLGSGRHYGFESIVAATNVHLSWGLIGWVTMLAMAIAYQVVPMFQLTRAYPAWLRNTLAPLLMLTLLTSTMMLSVSPTAFAIGVGVGAALIATFAVTTLYLQRTRRRRHADATVRFWLLAMLCLLTAVALWTASAVGIVTGERWNLLAGAWMIVGFAGSSVMGMLYKIIPFLAWLHLHAQGVRYALPNMKTLIPDSRSLPHTWLHSVALVLIAPAIWAPQPWIYPAALALLASFIMLSTNIIAASVQYHRVRSVSLAPHATEPCSTT